MNSFKRVLLLYTDRYYLIKHIYPFGLDLLARHLRSKGYAVQVEYPFLPDEDLEKNLREILERTDPQVIGLGLRNIDTCMSCETYGDVQGDQFRTFHFLSWIKAITACIRRMRPNVPVVAGGGAFTIAPKAILKYLGLRYGIVGEGEGPFQQFLEAYPDSEKLSRVSGLVWLHSGKYHCNSRQPYFFPGTGFVERDPGFQYAYHTTGIPVQVKRGCNQHCSYCVEPAIEGRSIVFRQLEVILGELEGLSTKYDGAERIFFVDTEFNIPTLFHSTSLLECVIASGLSDRFRFASQLLPRPFDGSFARLLEEAGFSIILTCDSFSDRVLEQNGCSYRWRHIVDVLQITEDFGIDCTVSLVFGLPGESRETMDETLGRMMRHPAGPLRRYEYTIGGRVYPGTPLSRLAREETEAGNLYGEPSEGFLSPYYYCSPDSPFRLKAYIDDAIPFAQTFENRFDANERTRLAIAYLADHEKWNEASMLFAGSGLRVKSAIFEYLFKGLLKVGKKADAVSISQGFLRSIQESKGGGEYQDQVGIIQYYLSFLRG